MSQAGRLLDIVFMELSKSAQSARPLPPKRHYDYLKARDFNYDTPDRKDLKEITKAVRQVQHEAEQDKIEELIEESRKFSRKKEINSIKLRLAQLEAMYSNLKKKGTDAEQLKSIEEKIERIKAMIY
jgi:hypothetical protein